MPTIEDLDRLCERREWIAREIGRLTKERGRVDQEIDRMDEQLGFAEFDEPLFRMITKWKAAEHVRP